MSDGSWHLVQFWMVVKDGEVIATEPTKEAAQKIAHQVGGTAHPSTELPAGMTVSKGM